MSMSTTDPSYYLTQLYPLQDAVLAVLQSSETGFYLSGGTAVSRYYLQHRFSDDLDFFVNDHPDFLLWSDRFIQALLPSKAWSCTVANRDERFVRLWVQTADVALKIELINDVPAHIGKIREHPVLGRVDSAENILANKVTAVLGRNESKDLADIWGFCCLQGLSLTAALDNAQSKAAGIFAPDLARALSQATATDWQIIRWISPPPLQQFLQELQTLAEDLLII
jgi:predicted nucleotidyltransferase component of viral defense system